MTNANSLDSGSGWRKEADVACRFFESHEDRARRLRFVRELWAPRRLDEHKADG
jgi:hypothetical protein